MIPSILTYSLTAFPDMNIATSYHGFLPYQSRARLREWGITAHDPRNWASCGFFSLHHAMVFLGQGTRFQWLREQHARLLDKLWAGTESRALTCVAKKFKLKARVHTSRDKTAPIRRALDRALAAGRPVIVGSEPNVHWICIGGRTDNEGYVWADSGADPAIGAFDSWDELEHWMLHRSDRSEPAPPPLKAPLEIIEIQPGSGMPARRSMVPWVGGIWESLASDPAYAKDWSNLLADMLDVFWDHDYAPNGRPAGEFLDEHLGGIVEAVSYQTGRTESSLRAAGLSYRDAADFHSLVVARGQDAHAIAGFSLKLATKTSRHRPIAI